MEPLAQFLLTVATMFIGLMIGFGIAKDYYKGHDSVKYMNYYESPLEVTEYDPNKDILAVFVGSEENVPPPDILEEIKDTLDDLPKCSLLVAPGFFRVVVLKGEKKCQIKTKKKGK